MYNVVYLPTARQQLMDAAMYIATELFAPDAAESLLDEVDTCVKALCEMPYRYSVYHTLYAMKHEIRFVPIKGYLLFYAVQIFRSFIWSAFLRALVASPLDRRHRKP